MHKYYETYDKRYKQVHSKGLSWSTNNNTLMVEQMIKKYHLEDQKMLEIGCGEGRDARYLLNKNYSLILCFKLLLTSDKGPLFGAFRLFM